MVARVWGVLVNWVHLGSGKRVGRESKENCLEKGVREVSNRQVRGWSKGMLKGNGYALWAVVNIWMGAQEGLAWSNREANPEGLICQWCKVDWMCVCAGIEGSQTKSKHHFNEMLLAPCFSHQKQMLSCSLPWLILNSSNQHPFGFSSKIKVTV